MLYKQIKCSLTVNTILLFPMFKFNVCSLAFNSTLSEEKCDGREGALMTKLCSGIIGFCVVN
jgi:hypothetical protein